MSVRAGRRGLKVRPGARSLVVFVVLALAPAAAVAQAEFLEEIEDADADLDVDLDEKPAGGTTSPSSAAAPAKTSPGTAATTTLPIAGGPTRGSSDTAPTAAKVAPPGDKRPDAAATTGAGDEAPEKVPLSISDVEVLPFSFDGLMERWDTRQKAHKTADAAARARADSFLEEGLRSYGVQGLRGGLQAFDFASALVEESRRAREQGDIEKAQDLNAFAARVGPDLPRVHAHAARVRLASSDFPGAVASFIEWGRALMREPTSTVLVAMGALTVALVAVLLVLLLASLVFLVRSFRFLAFDLHNALPRGAARWQLQLLVVLLAALPVVTAAGPVVACLWWLTLAWVYLSVREQIIVGVLALLLVAAPFAVETVSVLWSWPGSRLADAYGATYDIGERQALRAIEAIDEPSRSLRERAVLASKLKREGHIEQAYEAWRSIVQEAPQETWAHNNLGVVAALAGKEEHAIAELEAARDRDANATEAIFNLAQIHLRHGRTDKAAKLLDDLEQRVPLRLETYRTHTFRPAGTKIDQNRAFVDAAAPQTPIADLYRSPQPGAAALEREVAGIAFFGLNPSLAAGMIGAFLLLWLALTRVKARLQPSQPCMKCGSAASRRYDAEEVPRGMCSACFHAFLNPRARVEAGMKVRKERQVATYKRRYGTIVRLMTLGCPGAGHLYGGAASVGTALALMFAVTVSAGVLAFGPMPWPHLKAELPLWILGGLLAMVLVTVYAVAFKTVGQLTSR